MASRKMKQKDPGTNPGGSKAQREMDAGKNKMEDKNRRPDKGSKILKGNRRRAG